MDSDLNFYIQYCIYMKKLLSTSIKFTVLSVETYCVVVTEKVFPSFNLMLCILYNIFPFIKTTLNAPPFVHQVTLFD